MAESELDGLAGVGRQAGVALHPVAVARVVAVVVDECPLAGIGGPDVKAIYGSAIILSVCEVVPGNVNLCAVG